MNPALIPGEIVDPMRNDHARSEAREIMIKRFERLLTVHFAIAVQGAQELFLLGIDAQDWVVGLQELLDERGDMAKLCVAMRRVAALQHLGHLAPGKTEPIENPSHDARTGPDCQGHSVFEFNPDDSQRLSCM